MTRPHPDDLRAVLASNRPHLHDIIQTLQAALASNDTKGKEKPNAQDYTRR